MQAPKVLVRGNLNPETYKTLSHLAVDRGVTRSALVEEAVEAYLAALVQDEETEVRDLNTKEDLQRRLLGLREAIESVISAEVRVSYRDPKTPGIGAVVCDGDLPIWSHLGRVRAILTDSTTGRSIHMGEEIEKVIAVAAAKLVAMRKTTPLSRCTPLLRGGTSTAPGPTSPLLRTSGLSFLVPLAIPVGRSGGLGDDSQSGRRTGFRFRRRKA